MSTLSTEHANLFDLPNATFSIPTTFDRSGEVEDDGVVGGDRGGKAGSDGEELKADREGWKWRSQRRERGVGDDTRHR